MAKAIPFSVDLSEEDIGVILNALGKRFKFGKDDPIKTVALALVVAELEVGMYKTLMAEAGCVNLDEVIDKVRFWSLEQGSSLNERWLRRYRIR